MKIGVCKICGAEFERKQSNQKYCCKECSKVAEKIFKKLSDGRKREQSRKADGSNPMQNILRMMKIANELTEKTGRFHQYGDVQKLIRIGKLKIKDGAIVWSGSGLDFPAV